MVNWQRNLAIVAAGVFIASVGFSIVTPFLPALVVEVGVFSNVALWSGIVFAVNFLTSSLMAPVWGSLADQVGKRPMMLRAGIGIAVTYAFMAYSHSIWELAAWRALNGLLAGYIPAANVLVASNTPDSYLGRALGTLQAVGAAGVITGPLIGGAAAELLGPRGAILLAAALLGVAGILPFVGGVQEELADRTRQIRWDRLGPRVVSDVRKVLADRRLSVLFAVHFLFATAQLMTQPTLPLYVASLVAQNAAITTGAVYAAAGLATAIGAPAASRWADRTPMAALRAGIPVAAVLHALQGLIAHPLYLAAIRFAFGLAASVVVVSSGVLIARSTPASHRGRTFGVLQAINGMGAVAGPFIGGMLGDTAGLEAPFWAGAAVIAAAYWMTSAASRAAWRSTEADRRNASSSSGASGSSIMRSTPEEPTTQGMPR